MRRILLLIGLFAMTVHTSLSQQNDNAITIGRKDEISSRVLGEKRKLNIYLPDGYKQTDTTTYPVIYLLDGGLDEDFIHVAGLVQFNTFPWVNRLSPSIIVGIANTDRKRDMTFPTTIAGDKEKYPTTGGSAKFIEFIEKELQPYIQLHYRAGNTRTLIGESLGGLLATEVLLKRPYLFDKYIIISPSLWWDDGSLLRQNMNTASLLGTHVDVYIAVGKEGLAPGVKPHVMEVDANLLADKLAELKDKHISLYFDYLPGENHATIAHQAVLNAFKKLHAGN